MCQTMVYKRAIWCFLTYLTCLSDKSASAWSSGNENIEWRGSWFPHVDGLSDANKVIEYRNSNHKLHDDKHGIKMGVPSDNCDDGQMNLVQDWLNDPTNYTCFSDKDLYIPKYNVHPIFVEDHIPPHYSAPHKCMDTKIVYDNDIPTFGPHRPLWAKYGEYQFLPRQRWVHNLEHGAVVMLYHPCANKVEVNFLRQLIEKCLYRYIITPYNLLTPERPLALVAWGRKLIISKVDPLMVQEFIKQSAKNGPEQLSKDGQYDYGLLKHAAVVTTEDDDVLCPN